MIHFVQCLLLGGLTLNLAPEARVRGSEVDLGALATIGGDPELCARAKSLELGFAPAPGYARVFQRWQLERQLAAAFPGVTIEITGADACRVMPQTRALAANELAQAAERALRALFGEREATLSLHPGLRELEIPLGLAPHALRVVLDGKPPRSGAWAVPVQVWVDGALYQTVTVDFTVEAYEELPVLVRAVRRGDVLAADAVEMRRVRRFDDASGPALDGTYLVGAVAERELAAGAVVTARDVRRARLVRQGDTIQIEVRKGAITARSTALARQDGCMGDTVRVVTAGSAREITARVIGRDQVELALTHADGGIRR